jgi:uncharacterized membrane protein YdfJ with MMPL/SSD domain
MASMKDHWGQRTVGQGEPTMISDWIAAVGACIGLVLLAGLLGVSFGGYIAAAIILIVVGFGFGIFTLRNWELRRLIRSRTTS